MSVTLMLRPSPTSVRMARTPSAVAGTLTYRLGSAMRSCRSRAEATVPASSRARSGATSRDTNPSTPSLSSCTGRRMASAASMSDSAIAQ